MKYNFALIFLIFFITGLVIAFLSLEPAKAALLGSTSHGEASVHYSVVTIDGCEYILLHSRRGLAIKANQPSTCGGR